MVAILERKENGGGNFLVFIYEERCYGNAPFYLQFGCFLDKIGYY